MDPAGQVQVDAARTDGRWEAAYEPQGRATVPPDLEQALDASPASYIELLSEGRTLS
jgi:uncharacterized protein YdeI (YjbR/CyaY-like superfamily)